MWTNVSAIGGTAQTLATAEECTYKSLMSRYYSLKKAAQWFADERNATQR